jgi:hypothetical protein
MVSKCEACASAASRDLKLVDDLFPKLISAHSLISASNDDCFEEATEVKLSTTD